MHHRKGNILAGYIAGIMAGVSYGTNPLFAKDLLRDGVPVLCILFFRYLFASIVMCIVIAVCKETFRINKKQAAVCAVSGLLYATSSLTLFDSYHYIPAGLATTIVYLYPVFTALIMIALKVRPSKQTLLAVAATFIGVFIMAGGDGETNGKGLNLLGLALSATSALCYALYLVIINKASVLKDVSAHTITLYSLFTGMLMFALLRGTSGGSIVEGINDSRDWLDLVGLGIVPTMIAMLSLAISTKNIGPTKTSVLGVFEPVTAIAIGTVVFSEPFTMRVAIGVAICIGAVVFMATDDGRSCTKGASPSHET